MSLMGLLRGDMETERLRLRRWQPGDLPDFLKFITDEEVMAPSGAEPARTLAEAERKFHQAVRDAGCYAIVLKETGRPIGKIKFQRDLRRRPDLKSLSVAYQLTRAYWNYGYMTEALGAMIACAFERQKVDVLAISHFPENHRSRRVIEKCGFHKEGVVRRAFCRYDGRIFDDEIYSILREEYFAGKNPKR